MIELKVDRLKIENGFRMTFEKNCVRIPQLISSLNTRINALGVFMPFYLFHPCIHHLGSGGLQIYNLAQSLLFCLLFTFFL